MSALLSKFRKWWQHLFFWQQTKTGSEEFKPHAQHDHALVLSLKEPSAPSRWYQLRFLNHVLSPKEQRLLWGSAAVSVVALSIGVGLLVQPHLLEVPVAGGIVTEALIGSPKLVNPLYAPLNDVDRDLTTLIYSGLFRINDRLEPEPDIAASYRWVEEGKILEVKLREDVRFHDGIPLTTDDVVFTYQTVRNPSWRSPLASTFKTLEPIRVDEKTIQFKLEKPNPHLLTDLTLGILPAHIWEDVPGSTASLAEANLKPIGSGPYQVESFKRDAKGALLSYKLKKFPRYYGQAPYIEEWQFRFHPDRVQAQAALQSKHVDAIAFVPWKDVPGLKHGDTQSVKLELPQETVAFLNVKNPLLKDVRVRQALSMAVDPRELQELLGNHTSIVTSPFPFLEATTSTKNGDLEAARVLLNTIGWRLPTDGSVRIFQSPGTSASPPPKLTASSTELAITIDLPDQSDLIKVAELLKRRWSLIGARVDIRVSNAEDLLRQAIAKRDYQVLIWNVLLPPTQDIAPFWASDSASQQGLNLSNLTDRDVDRALEAIKIATSTASLDQARQELSTAILKQSPALFLSRPAYAYLLSQDIKGVKDMRLSRPSERLLQASTWYIKTGWRWK